MRRIKPIAFLVAAAVLCTAAWSTGGGVPEKSTSGGEKSVKLNALFFSEGADGPSGGTNVVTVRLARTGSAEFRVGFTEDEVGGTGNQWKAAGWNAATVATILTGSPLTGNQVTFDVTGRIDGPSAGALMTVGILSLLRGDAIKPDVTMTGTINPDGTVGPVGGIPYKIDGVKKAKKKRMLIPVGQRNSPDNDGNLVDVYAEGRKKGIAVSEVKDIYAVYKAFTGKTLPRPGLGDEVTLAAEPSDRLKAKVKDWLAQYQSSVSDFSSLSPDMQSNLADLMSQASEAADTASKLSDNDLPAGAYSSALEAAALANAAVKTGEALQIYDPADTAPFIAKIESSAALSGRVEGLFDELKSFRPKTVTDSAALIDAFSNAIDALSLSGYADNLLSQVQDAPDEETALTNATVGAVYYEFAGTLVASSQDILDVGRGLGGARLAKGVNLKRVADFFRKAAEANLNAFETLVIEEIANSNQANLEVVKSNFAEQDFDYALATSSIGVLEGGIDEYLGESSISALAKLGGAVSLYARSSQLIAKYYSLEAELDDELNVTGVRNEKALVGSLELARDQVERNVALLRSRKVEPALVVADYEDAGVKREGDVSDKLDALSSYWAAFVESRVLAYLGGFETAGLGKAPVPVKPGKKT